MIKSSVFIFICCLTLVLFSLGCSSSGSQSNTKETNTAKPEETDLSYDTVIKNIDVYKGKRVRWFGQQFSFDNKTRKREATTIVSFADQSAMQHHDQRVSANNLAQIMHNFAVEYQMEDQIPNHFESGWIEGIIVGSYTMNPTTTSTSGAETKSETKIPLLNQTKFEKGSGNR